MKSLMSMSGREKIGLADHRVISVIFPQSKSGSHLSLSGSFHALSAAAIHQQAGGHPPVSCL